MSRETPRFFEGTPQERILVALASPFLAVLCVGGLVATHASFDGPSAPDWRSRLMDHVFLAIFSEMFIAFLALLAVAFIWALLRPAWTVRVLHNACGHVWHALLFFLAGFGVSLMIVYAVA
jgi:hypothetical protein